MPISQLVGLYLQNLIYMKADKGSRDLDLNVGRGSNDLGLLEEQGSNNSGVNPNFKKEFGEYLEANGYALSNQPAHPGDALYFFRNGQGVMIIGDSIDFASFKEQDSDKFPSCSTYAAFTGISRLDTYGWMMLMHITGVVPLSQFMLGGSSKPLRTWPGWAAAAVC